ncbi:MAG TPA: hypothetical protein VMF10_13295 [Candidatus Aquilonibacter sp.]|nr:hypothetical protein [Candidatus Aquilonibacter sp.]
MHVLSRSSLRKVVHSASSLLSFILVLTPIVLTCAPPAKAIPAFARKYGLRCSACHETWPILNNFGLKFRDNGYQLMNDRDAPIWQNPGYWPATFRMTPFWHRFSNLQAVDTYTAGAVSGAAIERITSTGVDLSGLDFHTGGTLYKNISFFLLPSSDPTGAFHFETVMTRFDNILGSTWLNIRLGKFELNNLLSEKRLDAFTADAGGYATYHFIPVGDGNIFGQMGDNQLGIEYMGHSYDDRTRVSAALLDSNDGNVGLTLGANSYSGFFTFDQAIDTGRWDVQRIGGYAWIGQAATYYKTSGGVPILGSGINNKGFSRVGLTAQFYLGPHFDLNVVTQHGEDNAWFGQGYGNAVATDGDGGVTCTGPTATTPGCPPNATPGTVLPATARAPSWNGYTFEARYVYSPTLIFIGRYEAERMSQQATVGLPGNLGNINLWDATARWNPFMTSRAGMALQAEYTVMHQIGTGPTVGLTTANVNDNEVLLGTDFDF